MSGADRQTRREHFVAQCVHVSGVLPARRIRRLESVFGTQEPLRPHIGSDYFIRDS
nr:hypothetical protein pPsy0479b_00051 [Pseudomonas syringae]